MLQHDPKIAAEVAAARANCVTAPLPHLGMLVLAGSDARRFLHGQCTQEVNRAGTSGSGYAFFLDARGRNLGDFTFVINGGAIGIVLDRDRLESTAQHLERFIIAADVRIVRSESTAVLVAGPAAPGKVDRSIDEAMLLVEDYTYGIPAFQVWGRDPAIAATSISAAALEVLRIEAGRPRFGVDLDETVLPGESGQGDRAVSYTKGCYSGQEVVAKQKYLGKPRKALVGVLPEADVEVPAALAGDAGRITSCVWSPTLARRIGLAMVRTGAGSPGDQVVTESGVRATIAALPFVPPTS